MPLDAGELKLEVVDDAHATIIRFPPQTALVEANAEAFSQQLNTLAAQRQPPHLVIDLANVSLLTSVILAKLITLNAKIRAAGGHLELIHAAPAIYEVFHITRLDTILDVQVASH
ncbi:MAG: STAS domain-containing protein [Gemmataceae bacterium]|nr:STAS domain-containing protein [Gemmata sp.]MDW8199433.1 STAS domain-containing protein [Gemmataceae bacterium]